MKIKMKMKMKMKIFHMIILNYSSNDFLNKLNMYVIQINNQKKQ